MMYSPQFAPSIFIEPPQLEDSQQPLQLQQQQQQHINSPWPDTFYLGDSGPLMSLAPVNLRSSLAVSSIQSLPIGSYASLMPMLSVSSPLAIHLAAQQQPQQEPSLSTLQSPPTMASFFQHPLALQQPQQQPLPTHKRLPCLYAPLSYR